MLTPKVRSGGSGSSWLACLAAALLSWSALSTATAQTPPAAQYAALEIVKPVTACANLATFDLTAIGGAGSRVTSAKEQRSSQGAAVCAVEGVLAPSITFSVELPTESWAQRYLQIGCGGLCGRVAKNVGAADGCVPLNAGGFVIAATDMGHQDQDGSFGRDPQKRADFAHRAQHLTAVTSKALIQAFYGQKAAYAYFNGCSDGGREALIEAQRYPDDFNGIIAGASALNFQAQNAVFHAWQARANTGADGKPILLASRLPILHQAVLAACDKLDGLADGLIQNPLACHFDPATVQCPAGAKDTSACLTAAEVGVVRKFYDGPRDPATGTRLTAGGPQFGSELAWAGVYVPSSHDQKIFSEMVSLQVLRNMAFETNPPASFGLADMKFDLATFDKLRPRHALFDATNPDLSAFSAAGGKLILWHGWADQHISPINTIAYYTAVEKQMGKTQADAFTRLYLFPGMYHCGNGEGPYQVDLLTPMMSWVEKGAAPEVVVASQPEQAAASDFGAPVGDKPGKAGKQAHQPAAPLAVKILRTRPVYPWPYTVSYAGKGDVNQAASFVRGPAIAFDMPAWAGADFFTPYTPLQR